MIIKPEPPELFDAIGYPLREPEAARTGTFSNVIDHKPLTVDALLETVERLKREIDSFPLQEYVSNPIPPHYWNKLRSWNCIDARGAWLPESQWTLPPDA